MAFAGEHATHQRLDPGFAAGVLTRAESQTKICSLSCMKPQLECDVPITYEILNGSGDQFKDAVF